MFDSIILKILVVNSILLLIMNVYANEDKYEVLDKIIVIVEKDVITQSEFELEINKRISTLTQNNSNSIDLVKIRKEVLDSLVNKKLITQYANRFGLLANNDEVNLVLGNILKINNLSIQEFEAELSKNKISINQFKKDLAFDLSLKKIKDKFIVPNINVSKYEEDAWLNKNLNNDEEYNLMHILIKENNPYLNEVKKTLNNNNFQEIAKKYSDGPFANKGGNMGWVKYDELPNIFIEEIKKIKEGDVTEIFKSGNGYHFIKLNKIRNSTIEKNLMIQQIKFQQIILKKNDITNNEEIKKKLQNIKNQIENGLNFNDALIKYSDDQSSIDIKNLPWINKSSLPQEFIDAINKKISSQSLVGPLNTEVGWHLLKIYETREEDISSQSKRDQARLELINKKTDIAFKDWIESLKENSTIKILDND